MNRGAFESAEVKYLENKIGKNYFIAIFAEEKINTENQFNDLYLKSRGCLMEDNWCFFLTGKTEGKKLVGNMHKLSPVGIEMLVKKFDIELK